LNIFPNTGTSQNAKNAATQLNVEPKKLKKPEIIYFLPVFLFTIAMRAWKLGTNYRYITTPVLFSVISGPDNTRAMNESQNIE
jgi:hypothetical protein